MTEANSDRKQTKTCRHCCSEIPLAAKVCKDCNRQQGRLLSRSTEATVVVGSLGCLLTLFLSWQQTEAAKVQAAEARQQTDAAKAQAAEAHVQNEEARKERIAAEEAARRAEEALKVARATEANLKNGLLRFVSVEYIRMRTSFRLPMPAKVQDEINKDLDDLLLYAIPDGTAREKWLQNVDARINSGMK